MPQVAAEKQKSQGGQIHTAKKTLGTDLIKCMTNANCLDRRSIVDSSRCASVSNSAISPSSAFAAASDSCREGSSKILRASKSYSSLWFRSILASSNSPRSRLISSVVCFILCSTCCCFFSYVSSSRVFARRTRWTHQG